VASYLVPGNFPGKPLPGLLLQWFDGSDRIRACRALKLALQANSPLCWIRKVNLSLSALALVQTRLNPDSNLASPVRAQVNLTPPWDVGSVSKLPGVGCKVWIVGCGVWWGAGCGV
jgi:hypothetical protein